MVAVLGPDMRRLMGEHPEISMRLVIALGRRLRETNERLSRQSFRPCRAAWRWCSASSSQQAVADGQRPARTCW